MQIDRLGGGVSHAIGLGGRDLSAEVGGITCLQAIACAGCRRGHHDHRAHQQASRSRACETRSSVSPARCRSRSSRSCSASARQARGQRQRPLRADARGDGNDGRGAGGHTGVPAGGASPRAAVDQGSLHRRDHWPPRPPCCSATRSASAADAEHAGRLRCIRSGGHEVIDLGDDVYTRGRPHPMIDPSSRNERIPAVFDDPENAVLLLDVVLGFGSDPDPAGALATVIADGLARLRADGRDLAVVASVCGTDDDPQSLSAQTLALEQAGVAVLPSNAAAVRHALAILRRRDARRPPRRTTCPGRSAGCSRNRRGSSTSVCANSPRHCTTAAPASSNTTGACRRRRPEAPGAHRCAELRWPGPRTRPKGP